MDIDEEESVEGNDIFINMIMKDLQQSFSTLY